MGRAASSGRRSRRRSLRASWKASRYRWKPVSRGLSSLRGSNAAQNRGACVLDVADAGERHGDVELLLHHLQRLRHAGLALRAEPVDERAADHRRLGAERERLEEALPAADAAVEPDVDL